MEQEIKAAEEELKEMELAEDGETADVVKTLREFEGADALSQEIVNALVENVVVYDPEHVEVVGKFSDEVYEFIVG